jgi:hypothetical protein
MNDLPPATAAISWLVLGLTVSLAACATGEDEIGTSGFNTGVGGATGGAMATGGMQPMGGLPASGGLPTSGGTPTGSGGILPVTCAAGETQCGAVCVSLGTNENCSACDDTCPANSSCQTPAGDPAAGGAGAAPVAAAQCICDEAGTTACADGCFVLASDVAHCGDCANACGAGATCEGGVCICPPDTLECAGFAGCVDILTSDEHCGVDCLACEAPTACQAGACVCPADGVIMLCGDICTDTSSDVANCGGCAGDTGIACGPGELCKAGACSLELTIDEANTFVDIPTGGTFGILIDIAEWAAQDHRSGTLQCQVDSGIGTILVDIDGFTDEVVFVTNNTTSSVTGVPALAAGGTLEVPDSLTGLRCQIYW